MLKNSIGKGHQMQILDEIVHPTPHMIILRQYLGKLLPQYQINQVDNIGKDMIKVIFDNVERSFMYDALPDPELIVVECTIDLLKMLMGLYSPSDVLVVHGNVSNIISEIVHEVTIHFMEKLVTSKIEIMEFNEATLWMRRSVRSWIV